MSTLTNVDRRFVRRAVEYLEHPSFVIKVANKIGLPLTTLTELAPRGTRRAVDSALHKAATLAVASIHRPARTDDVREVSRLEIDARVGGLRHSTAAAAVGTCGGLFGFGGLLFELPVTTCLMLRSIASVARDFGEDLRDPNVRLECLSVFSLGGPTPDDDGMESSYLTARLALASLVANSAQSVSRVSAAELQRMIANGTAPALVRLLAAIAPRFNLLVTQKLMLQAIPAVGALGGGLINALLCDHFNTVARYHFGLRNLERTHGREKIRDAYQQCRRDLRQEEVVLRQPDYSYRGLTAAT